MQGSEQCNIRKAFIQENIGIFFNIRARKFRSRKYKEFFLGVDFFILGGGLGWEVGQVVLNYTTTTSTQWAKGTMLIVGDFMLHKIDKNRLSGAKLKPGFSKELL